MSPRLVIVAHEVGAWVHHRAATAELARERGWDVTLLMGGEGDPVPLTDLDVVDRHAMQRLPMARGTTGPREVVRSVLMIRRTMADADAVELVTLKPVVLGMFASRTLSRRRRPRLVATFAGLGTVLDAAVRSRTHWFVLMLRVLLRGRCTVLVENPDDGSSLVAAGIVRAQDIVIGPGVGLPDAWFDLNPNDVRADDHPVTILYVGRLIASKGVVDLIAALEVLRERGTPVIALLAGSLDDRNPSAVSAGEVSGWVGDGLVDWLGHVTDPVPSYRRADLVVLPSHREGRPRSLMEAQALGIPVIATDVPGCRQVLDPNVTGLLVPAQDPVALADAIQALAADRDRRAAMGAAGRAWAREQFGSERFLEVWASTVLGTTDTGRATEAGRATGHPADDR